MRIVLDTAILVRAHDGATGLARDLLLRLIESDHVLLISDAMLYELAKVLRYPRMLALHGLSESRIYDYIGFLRRTTEVIRPNPLLVTPIRDINDTVVMQTAIIGEADVLCTRDQDFFEPPAEPFLRRAGIAVLDDIALMQRLRF
ncbi:MAG: putative toxin-antitoxin system toxin component, PIN family [Acidobacteria bacterium]|nr:putative toxin-antitoxin system toxin component, PIN family [Bryobacteraceae bacterium CoA2 C42]